MQFIHDTNLQIDAWLACLQLNCFYKVPFTKLLCPFPVVWGKQPNDRCWYTDVHVINKQVPRYKISHLVTYY